MAFCVNCGQSVDENGNFCPHCGHNMQTAAPKEPTSPPPQRGDITNDEYISFIGPKAHNYLFQFNKFMRYGFEDFKPTWHWPAFLVGPWWFLYRKLYLAALIAFVACWIPYVNFLAKIGFGLLGNYLYFKHCNQKIASIKATCPPEHVNLTLSHVGGTNGWVPVAAVIVSVLVAFLFMVVFAGISYYY
ncbi:MAG: DUF2628 domain-containing protein [Firmicutes bacterium]|nr:DUF2628 domain-containing protein [Bacillota bacterium]